MFLVKTATGGPDLTSAGCDEVRDSQFLVEELPVVVEELAASEQLSAWC